MMHRHVVVVLLIVSIMSGTMVVGCGGGSIALQIGIVAVQFLGSLALDQLIRCLSGSPEAAGLSAQESPLALGD